MDESEVFDYLLTQRLRVEQEYVEFDTDGTGCEVARLVQVSSWVVIPNA